MSRLPSVQPAAVYPTINRPLRFAAQPGGLPSLEVRGARRRQTHSRVAAVAVVRPPAWIISLWIHVLSPLVETRRYRPFFGDKSPLSDNLIISLYSVDSSFKSRFINLDSLMMFSHVFTTQSFSDGSSLSRNCSIRILNI